MITKATVNVRDIVDLKTQRSLSEQIDDPHAMPEHGLPHPHSPAQKNVHYAKTHKELENLGQPSPSPLTGFASKSYDGYYPPDPHGAVSENFVVGSVNDELYVQDRSGNLLSDIKLKNFWGPVHTTIRLFDPRLVYDPNAHIWVLVTAANAFSDSSCLLIALSQTEDPTASWNLYKVKADSAGTLWADYPSIAFNKNWVVVTVNLFGDTSNSSDTGRIYLFNKSEMMNGLTPQMKIFDVDQGVYPAVTYDSSMNNLYLLETFSEPAGQLQMLKIYGTLGSEMIASVGYPAVQMTWGQEPANGNDLAPQLNDTAKLQCNDDRMGSVLCKNNIIWGTHTIFLPADAAPARSSVMWWAIDTNGEVLQNGLIDDPTGSTFYAFPSIAVNKYNDALISYSIFSARLHPGAGYSYHDHKQSSGSSNNSYQSISGQNTYSRSGSGRDRWGDCSATVVDPLNDIDFWTINEYAESTANNWGTWWANVGGSDTLDHATSGALNVVLFPNPNNGNFNLSFLGQVHTAVQIDIYDMLGKRLYSNNDPDPQVSSIWISLMSGYLEDGIYIARIIVNGQTIDKKIMVHH